MARQLLPGIPNEVTTDGIREGMGSLAVTIGTWTNETFPNVEEQDEQHLPQTNEKFPKSEEQDVQLLLRTDEMCSKSEKQDKQLLPQTNEGFSESQEHDEQLLPQTNERFAESREQDGQLLPGMLDEITLNHITTKLPWRAVYTLSLVSPGWQRAIQSRRVYDARVRYHSAETLVVHSHPCRNHDLKIAMFSMRDKCCYELPPIPQLHGGISSLWKYICFDGKIYVLGGWKEFDSKRHCFVGAGKEGGNELYVLDLAGQRHWKQCASMQGQRHRFACGAIDGKIYVFGGVDANLGPLSGSEVYDPDVNAWSPIMPMPRLRVHSHVEILGDELFVHDGTCYDPEYATWATEWNPNDHRRLEDFLYHALFADVYHPIKDEWRLIDPFGRNSDERVFPAQGKFYSMTKQGINVFDTANKSWKDLYSYNLANLFAAVGPIDDDVRLIPCPPIAVNDELLVVVYWFKFTIEHGFDNADNGGYFLQSKGFGRQNEEFSWQIISKCSDCFDNVQWAIQL